MASEQVAVRLLALLALLGAIAQHAGNCAAACGMARVFPQIRKAARRDIHLVRNMLREMSGGRPSFGTGSDDPEVPPSAAWDTRISLLIASQQRVLSQLDQLLPDITDEKMGRVVAAMRAEHAGQLEQSERYADLRRPKQVPQGPTRRTKSGLGSPPQLSLVEPDASKSWQTTTKAG